MLRQFLFAIDRLFDAIEIRWEGPALRRFLGSALAIIFVAAIGVIELNRLGVLPAGLAERLPTNHLIAIELAFTLLLTIEIVSLVFALAYSVAISVGKQFEVFSLILLRETFEYFSHFSEPLVWEEIQPAVLPIVTTAVGALAIFFVLGFFYRAQKHLPITQDMQEQAAFIATKKLIGLALLAGFVIIVINSLAAAVEHDGHAQSGVFETFYTLLIFSDILLVLIALRYSSTYHVAFRNSGFAVATVLIRIALIAPALIRSPLGIGTVLFALGVTLAYNKFTPAQPHPPQTETPAGL
ncbi:MAG: hypothetical protein Kow0031_06710 [Anaerolineae bacterium]